MIMYLKWYLYLYFLFICWILYFVLVIVNDNSLILSFGKWFCDILYRIIYIFFKILFDMFLLILFNKIGENIEFIGKGIFYGVIFDVRDVFFLIVGWKIFKVLFNF